MSSIENTCEEFFDALVDSFESVKESSKTSKSKFQDTMEVLFAGAFITWTDLESWEFDIIDKWKRKLRMAAGQWYVENVQRKHEQEEERKRREEEEQQRERQRAREERERERRELEREIDHSVGRLYDKLEINDKRIKDKLDIIISTGSIESLKDLLKELEEEIEDVEEQISDLPSYRQDEVEIWNDNLLNYKSQVEQRIADLEEAQRVAKRKEQDEANRTKLEQIKARWERKQNPAQQKVSVQNEYGKNNCPQCGNSVSDTAKFCVSCGTKLLVVCPNCQTSLKPTAKFCTNCGTPLKTS